MALDDLEEMRKIFQEAKEKNEKESEDFWNSLSKEEQLKAFCAVSRRIYQGEITDKGSYRHVLYTVFKFGPEAYGQAQCAGYLSIHNAIYDGERLADNIKDFCTKYLNITDETLDNQIDSFIKKMYF